MKQFNFRMECLLVAADVRIGGAPEAPLFRVARTTCCPGAGAHLGADAQEAGHLFLGTLDQLPVAPLRSTTRTTSCPGHPKNGGYLGGFLPFLTIFFLATLALPCFAQTPSPTPAAAQPSAAPAGDIRDIHGVISIPYEWLWIAYLLGALVLAALIYAAYRWYRARAKARAKLPFEIALEKLEAARALMTADTVREYAFTVSEIIRVYIEQRFGEKAARRTTEEFLSDLLNQTGTPLAQHSASLEDFLNHCDLIKFAKWGASDNELESMQESARAFILDTRPQPEPHPAKSGAKPELAPVK